MNSMIISPDLFRKKGGVLFIRPPKKKQFAVESVLIEHYAPYVTRSLEKVIKQLGYFCFIHKEKFHDGTCSYNIIICENRYFTVNIDVGRDNELVYQRYCKGNRYATFSLYPENHYYIATDIYNHDISAGSKKEFKGQLSSDYSNLDIVETDITGLDFIESSLRVFGRIAEGGKT